MVGEEQVTIDIIVNNGEQVYSLYWDSGNPGAGADIEYIYLYQGKYYGILSWEDEAFGPYDSLVIALNEIELNKINETCEEISSIMPSDEIIKILIWTGEDGKSFLLNDEQWQVDSSGKFSKVL